MKQLHKSTVIHNNSGGGLLKEVLRELVSSDILCLCPRGVKNSSRSTGVYIKQIPPQNNVDAEEIFSSTLAEYQIDKKPITIEMYRESCKNLELNAIGVVQEDVYETLSRPEYGNRDLSILNSFSMVISVNIRLMYGIKSYSSFQIQSVSILISITINTRIFNKDQVRFVPYFNPLSLFHLPYVADGITLHSILQSTYENNPHQNHHVISSSHVAANPGPTVEDTQATCVVNTRTSDETCKDLMTEMLYVIFNP
jgi:hypothetical protein